MIQKRDTPRGTLAEIAAETGKSVSTVKKAFRKFRAANARLDCNNMPADRAAADARLKTAQAIKTETENAVKAGKLHQDDDCERRCAEAGAQVRGAMLNAGNQLAPVLVGKDAREIKEALDMWADETLTSWADWAEARRAKP